ncbi:MAG: serine/threonine-protein kinase, partial [Planctomycetes bacterium]|nr:serine/threonine-protein kinase [Planctomycetota bacterium]
MTPDPEQVAAVAARITDPVLRERFTSAVSRGEALSTEELLRILSTCADRDWQGLVIGWVKPESARRSDIERLLSVGAVESDDLLDGRLDDHAETGAGALTGPGAVPQAKRSTVDRDEGASPSRPERIGRYRILRYVGGGGFGHVWQGWDDDLDRPVAVKVPNARRIGDTAAVDSFLAEARQAAALAHPHLVPVYEVGRDGDGGMFIVSQFINGFTLRQRLDQGPVPAAEAARLVATVARALHHAHTQGAGLIHRDVKPANILIDEATGAPFLADFGLAIAQTRSLAENDVAGTPAYMSPEQTKGEILDRRSDVFSLGAVLYELLTRGKAFSGASTHEILAAVARARPVPPRDCDPTIPGELERICLCALAQAKSARYQSAALFADDLDAWLGERSTTATAEADAPVVPKGLRSFDGDDARFFLQLLPGPRGRDGLPESIRFWKTRFDETDPDKTFAIGLLYGPSGCGKSSLVKAGIVPRLGPGVRAIVLEASADDTESRLLKALRKAVPALPAEGGLLAALARVRDIASGKVVIVLDQFEQWLQAHPDPADTDLVGGLRQCDGAKLQALVLVRDDFGLAANRFMDAVETRIEQGRNYATIDSFPTDHARDVLVRFGQGLGRLPRLATSFSDDEKAFVDQAIAGLAGDEKRVVPVQLALFADLVKSRPWTPATLDSLGETA